ncbi:hypothetical protein PS1_019944 [Malus domestica]
MKDTIGTPSCVAFSSAEHHKTIALPALGLQSSSAFHSQSTTQRNEGTSDGHVLPSNVQIPVVATSLLGEIVIADTQSTLPTEESTKASDWTSWFDAFSLFKGNFKNGDRVLCSIEDLIPSHPDLTSRVSFRDMQKIRKENMGFLNNGDDIEGQSDNDGILSYAKR